MCWIHATILSQGECIRNKLKFHILFEQPIEYISGNITNMFSQVEEENEIMKITNK